MADKLATNQFIPDHLLINMINLLDKCKCALCQKEKQKREQQLMTQYDKIVFLSKQAEEEWNSAPEGVKKLREKILQENIAETQEKILQEMEAKMNESHENKSIEFWRTKASEYEWLFKEQQDICAGYRKIIEELQIEVRELKIDIRERNWASKANGETT